MGVLAVSLAVVVGGAAAHATCSDDHFKKNQVFKQSDFEHCTSITDQKGEGGRPVLLYWDTDIKTGIITIGAQYPTGNGWVGIGFGTTGSMFGADIIVVTRDKAAGDEWVAWDMFATRNDRPTLDKHQDVKLLAVEVSDDTTFIKIERPLKTCHPEEDRDILDLEAPVLVAYSPSYYFGLHAWMHSQEINLVADHPHKHSSVSGEMYEDIVMPDFLVPNDDATQYCYTAHRLPADKKYHMIRAEPIFGSSHPETLHHIVIYSCWDDHEIEHLQSEPKCNDEAHAMQDGCDIFYTLWAVGSGALELPDIAGLPMGKGPNALTAHNIVMEVHYNNPKLIPNIRDSSGMRLVYTDKLRPQDASLLTLAHLPIKIPAFSQDTHYSNECGASCTKKIGGDLNVLLAFLHMHEIGSEIWTQHVRDGQELPPLGDNRHWNFNSQASTNLNAVIKPGDSLITHCKYKNPHNRTIRFGAGTMDEMCFNWLLVYPASNVVACSQGWRGSEAQSKQMCVTVDDGDRYESALEALFNVDRTLGPEGSMTAEVGDMYIDMKPTKEGSYVPYKDPYCAAREEEGGADLAPVLVPLFVVAAIAVGGGVWARRKRAHHMYTMSDNI